MGTHPIFESDFDCLTEMGSRQVRTAIKRVTEITSNHMTPELKLALVTPDSKFYHSKPDGFPFPDPYWAFYWPGGQALTRYILDSKDVDSYGRTLDFGCGCGSASMAILLRDHKASVTAADIDEYSLEAVRLNAQLNLSKDQT